MDKADLVALISTRSPKLKAFREQTANGNEYLSSDLGRRSDCI